MATPVNPPRGMRDFLPADKARREHALGVTAMAHLMGLADWVDLDTPMLISNDPFDGLRYDARARVSVPDRPGIGARLHAA